MFRARIYGLLVVRLLLGFFFLILTVLAQSRHVGDLLGAHLQPLYFFSVALFLFTIIAASSLKFAKDLRKFAFIQLFFDVGAVTFLIYISGGVESLYSFLYMLVITSGAVLLGRRGSMIAAGLSSLSYGLLVDLQYFGWISPVQVIGMGVQVVDSGYYFHTLLMNLFAFFLIAYLSGYLAEQLQKSSRQVLDQRKNLEELEALHKNIVQSVTSGLLTISPSGHILFSNPAAQDILGVPNNGLEGHHITEIFSSLPVEKWSLEKVDNSGQESISSSRLEVKYVRPSGEELYLGYTLSVLHGEAGKSAGWIFIFQDLTRLKAMEEHVRRVERLALAGNMAAEIAHEIKNPLASLSGAVQLIQGSAKDDPVQSRLVGIMDREINRINDMVSAFFWLAKGVNREEKVEEVPVAASVEEVLALLEARGKIDSSHHVSVDVESECAVYIDRNHFRQILWHLLANALEAMQSGGELQIKVSKVYVDEKNDTEVRIDIKDSGPGIYNEVRDKIFEPFFTTKKSGIGLGLSIVYQLVENAGGRIEVNNRADQGSVFSLFFPSSSKLPLAK